MHSYFATVHRHGDKGDRLNYTFSCPQNKFTEAMQFQAKSYDFEWKADRNDNIYLVDLLTNSDLSVIIIPVESE